MKPCTQCTWIKLSVLYFLPLQHLFSLLTSVFSVRSSFYAALEQIVFVTFWINFLCSGSVTPLEPIRKAFSFLKAWLWETPLPPPETRPCRFHRVPVWPRRFPRASCIVLSGLLCQDGRQNDSLNRYIPFCFLGSGIWKIRLWFSVVWGMPLLHRATQRWNPRPFLESQSEPETRLTIFPRHSDL